jgi:N-acetylmuramoyl-L-alanine amidase
MFRVPALPIRHLRLFLFFMIALIIGAPAHALSVDQMRIGVHPGKTRLVMELSNQTNYRVFTLPDPYRIVIDLPDFSWNVGNLPAVPGSNIKAIRHGVLGQGLSRVVLELSRPVAVQSAFMLPAGKGNPDRLVLDFNPAGESDFRSRLSRVHGNLTGGGMAMAPPPPVQTASAASAPLTAPEPEPEPVPPPPPSKMGKPVVVIDPGHGGPDAGAVGINGVSEKKVTLALAKELKSQLEATGQYKVVLTRNGDSFLKLRDRVLFAREHNADLFISIHADSIDKPGVRGASIYTLSDKASDHEAAMLAARENKADMIAGIDLSVEDEEVASILVDLAMRDTMNQSRFFSSKVSKNFSSSGLPLLDKPQRSAGFAVLKAPDIPSVLIEAGFMSNKKEAAMLNSSDHRRKLAQAIRRGIDAYFEQVRKNQRT